MKIFLISIFLLISIQKAIIPSKMLVIYYSRTGNTEKFAKYITDATNITSYRIIPANAYPEDYDEMLKIAENEIDNNARPEIKSPLTDVSNYDIILLGYPLWYGHIPNILITQLEKLNLNGKVIYPFNTHGSSGVKHSVDDIKSHASGATVKDGYAIAASKIQNKEDEVIDWLDDNFDLNSDVEFNSAQYYYNKIKYKLFLFICLYIII